MAINWTAQRQMERDIERNREFYEAIASVSIDGDDG